MRQRESEDNCVVFDIGGTSSRAAIYVSARKGIDRMVAWPTPNFLTQAHSSSDEICFSLLRQMRSVVEGILDAAQPSTVSIAFPGPIDGAGKILAAPTIWGSGRSPRIDLATSLSDFWPNSRIILLNDVSAAGYRYLRSDDENFCIVTVSSGIGHKVFAHGRPMIGPGGLGGEMGHVQIDASPGAPVCDCGGRGHLGAISSGRGALSMARRLATDFPVEFSKSVLFSRFGPDLGHMTNEDLVQTFHGNDVWAIQLIRHLARPLGQMLASIHLGTGVERFVLIGGFALALGEPYRAELARAAANCEWNLGQDWNRMLELGVADDNAGLIGAGRFATEFLGNSRR
jgi:glucokinase